MLQIPKIQSINILNLIGISIQIFGNMRSLFIGRHCHPSIEQQINFIEDNNNLGVVSELIVHLFEHFLYFVIALVFHAVDHEKHNVCYLIVVVP